MPQQPEHQAIPAGSFDSGFNPWPNIRPGRHLFSENALVDDLGACIVSVVLAKKAGARDTSNEVKIPVWEPAFTSPRVFYFLVSKVKIPFFVLEEFLS